MPDTENLLDLYIRKMDISDEASSGDPLGYDCALPLKARYYPMGFALDVETNSSAILEAAREVWSPYASIERKFAEPAKAVTIRVAVEDRWARVAPLPSMPRGQGHLMSIIHGPDNFAICDLTSGFAFVCLTRDVASDRKYFRYHFLEQAAYTMIDTLHFLPVHASCVELEGRAVLLCGGSGAGKTSLAYACARRGWSYLADDATHIVRNRFDYSVVGRPFHIRFRESSRELFPELRAHAAGRRPNGSLDLEIDTRALNLPIALESKAGWIVFLNRRPAPARTRIEPFAKSQAESWFREAICVGDGRTRSEQHETLRRFLTLPVLQLTWSEADHAENALRSLVTRTPAAT